MGRLYQRLLQQEQERGARAINAPGHNISELEAFGSGFADSATFGFGDELQAGLHGLGAMARGGDFSSVYEDRVRRARDRLSAAREQRPWITGAGNIAGAAAWGLGGLARQGLMRGGAMLAARPGVSQAVAQASGRGWNALRAQLGRSARYGAAAGAAYGAGSGEGDLASGDGNAMAADLFSMRRAPSAAIGAITGGLAAPATVAVAQPLTRGLGRVLTGATERMRSAATGAPYIAGRAVRDLDAVMGGAGDDVHALSRLSRRNPGARLIDGDNGAYRSAFDAVGGRFRRGHAAQARRAASGVRAPEPEVVADIATGNVFGLGRAALRQALRARPSGAPFADPRRNSELARLLRARFNSPTGRAMLRRLERYEDARIGRGSWEPVEEGRVTGVTVPMAHGQFLGADTYDPYSAMTDAELGQYYDALDEQR